jgi:hypothetical protein
MINIIRVQMNKVDYIEQMRIVKKSNGNSNKEPKKHATDH